MRGRAVRDRAYETGAAVQEVGAEVEAREDATKRVSKHARRQLYCMALLVSFCVLLCVTAVRLDASAAASARVDAENAASIAAVAEANAEPKRSLRSPRQDPADSRFAPSARPPKPPPVAPPAKAPRPALKAPPAWRRRAKVPKEKDMPPFAAPRLDPEWHKLNYAPSDLDAAACAAHEAAVPFHARAMKYVKVEPEPSPADAPRVLCIIYTYEAHHGAAAVASKTWLPRCDGALVLSDRTDGEVGAVAIPHEGPEEYNNIWQKTRANWRYVYEYYRDDFDYFHFGGDDLFVLPTNLRAFLSSGPIKDRQDAGEPLFLGRLFKQNGNERSLFNSGGSGYIFNTLALELLYDSLDEPFCRPHLKGFFEDVMVAECFKNGPAHLLPLDTRDASGAERFHPFTPGQHLSYRRDKNDWYTKYSFDLIEGPDYFAPDSVAFHYVKPELMEHMDAILHRCR